MSMRPLWCRCFAEDGTIELTDKPICPYLGTLGQDGAQMPGRDYPSFENQCFAVPEADTAESRSEGLEQLLLADQATFCLGSGHQLCPRYQALHGWTDPAPDVAGSPGEEGEAAFYELPDVAGDGTSTRVPNEVLFDEDNFNEADLDGTRWADSGWEEAEPRFGLWMGVIAATVFLFLCGGSLAAYTGWQLVGRGVVALPGRFSALAPEPTEAAPIFRLVTATAEPVAINSPLATLTPTATPTFAFPAAVTPTPGNELAPANSGNSSGPVVITTPTPAQALMEPAAPDLATAVAGPVVVTTPNGAIATPTRRPTPTFLVPTSTPISQTEMATATPAEPLPTAVIEFRAASQAVLPGECTILSWQVKNVQAVFFENEGVEGQGEQRVCLRYESQTFSLAVLHLDGSEETRTITVQLIPHTPTPTITPTFTPVLTPTPTWTPVGTPTSTSIPPQYGVTLAADGGNQKLCNSGQPCETLIQVSNTGNLADEIFLDLIKNGPWNAKLCRIDGACGETALSIGIGPGNTSPVVLRVDIPSDASGQANSYQIEAASGNSQLTVKAEPVTVSVSVP